ncbi:hypothetical protein SAMN05421595_1478 [Austwickia chelonae]|uniref:UPF0235 protein AUCHE_05_05550 n=1 Tax=Austwickia chelonae NBRC 105200 TaxID=1184607 RepID=K6VQJ6_9MICO|nr:DUF167 domain-containing protein [Austwickia chelonae]GAB77640.1 hypothetical protein AUCHE_05_05550 [Austwickia chelonae NBRC 105200]SEW14721.1 hypothetical protein SAMN05421595_1478 [Austwickia chelonae]
MRLVLRVRPGASRTRVGGAYEAPEGPQLCVAVNDRAVDGQATEAALKAVAKAFGVRPRQVTLVSGATSRSKIVEVDAPQEETAVRLRELLDR